MADIKTLAQLARLPNVFTAVSNVLAAYLLTHDNLSDVPAVALLLTSSALLYTAGMVLNDVFDVEQDTAERPARPIPSGRITVEKLRRLGWGLLAGGAAAGWAVSLTHRTATPGLVATLLAAAVVSYDGPLKRTPLAPLVMGTCRFLNVLLGLSLVSTGTLQWHPMHWVVAGGVGVYVVGLTLFARTEAWEESARGALVIGMFVMLAGTALLGYFPQWADGGLPPASQLRPMIARDWLWPVMWGLFGYFIVRRCLPAVVTPRPELVQFAVKQSIFALVIFDAAIVTAARPVPYALGVVALLLPMQLLGRWVYST